MSIAHIYQRSTMSQTRLHSLPQDILAIESTDVSKTANQAAILVREAMDARSVAIILHDAAYGAMRSVGASGYKRSGLEAEQRSSAIAEAAADVYRTGNPHFAGYCEDGTYRAVDDGVPHVHSVFILPLMVANERRGVVEIVMEQAELGKPNMIADLKRAVQTIGVIVQRAERVEHLVAEAAQRARNALIEDLTSTLNHDLRNMMAPIAGRLDLIRRQANRDGHEKYVRHAEEATNATKRMQAVLQNLVDVARLEQGELPLLRQEIALSDLVHSIVANTHMLAANAQIDVREAVHTMGDMARIQQTLEYLIGNAFRYSPEDEPMVITIDRTERDGANWASVAVCDRGVRIAPDVLPLVFTRWTNGRGSLSFNLGLYLAQGVAKAHGGTLSVTSDELSGTTWTLVLPIAD